MLRSISTSEPNAEPRTTPKASKPGHPEPVDGHWFDASVQHEGAPTVVAVPEQPALAPVGLGFGEAPDAPRTDGWEALSAWVEKGLGLKLEPAAWKLETARALRNEPGLPFEEALARATTNATDAKRLAEFLKTRGVSTTVELDPRDHIDRMVEHEGSLHVVTRQGHFLRQKDGRWLNEPAGTTAPMYWADVIDGELYAATKEFEFAGTMDMIPARMYVKEADGWKTVIDDATLALVHSAARENGKLYVAATVRGSGTNELSDGLFVVQGGKLVRQSVDRKVRAVAAVDGRVVALTDESVYDIASGVHHPFNGPVRWVKRFGNFLYVGRGGGVSICDGEFHPVRPGFYDGTALDALETGGKIYLAGEHGVYVQDGDDWKKAAKFVRTIRNLAPAPDGVYLSVIDKIVKLTPRPAELKDGWEAELAASLGPELDALARSGENGTSPLEAATGSIVRRGRAILSSLGLSRSGFGFGEAPARPLEDGWEALSRWVGTGLGLRPEPARWRNDTARILRDEPGLPFLDALVRAASTSDRERLKDFLEKDGLETLHQLPWRGGFLSLVSQDRTLYAVGIDGARKWKGTPSWESDFASPDGSPASWVGVAGGRLYVASRGKDDPGEKVPARLWRKEAGAWKLAIDDPSLLSVVSVSEIGGRLYALARRLRKDTDESLAPRLFEVRAGKLVERPLDAKVSGLAEVDGKALAITGRTIVELEGGTAHPLGSPVYFVKQVGTTVYVGTPRGLEPYDVRFQPLGPPSAETGGARQLAEIDGRLWLSADRGVFIQDGAVWKKAAEVEKGAGHIAPAPGGAYIATLNEVLRLTPRPSRLAVDWQGELLRSLGSELDEARASAPDAPALDAESGAVMSRGRSIFSALVARWIGRRGLSFGEPPAPPTPPVGPWEELASLLGLDPARAPDWRLETIELLRNEPWLPLNEALARFFEKSQPGSSVSPELAEAWLVGKPFQAAAKRVEELRLIEGLVYAAAKDGLHIGRAGSWRTELSNVAPIVSVAKLAGRLYAANQDGILVRKADGRWGLDQSMSGVRTLAEIDGIPAAFTKEGAYVRRLGRWWKAWGWPSGVEKVFRAKGRDYAFGREEKALYEKAWYGWRRMGGEPGSDWLINDAFEAGDEVYAVARGELHRIDGEKEELVASGPGDGGYFALGDSPAVLRWDRDVHEWAVYRKDGAEWKNTGLTSEVTPSTVVDGGVAYLTQRNGLVAWPHQRSSSLRSALERVPEELAKGLDAREPASPASELSGNGDAIAGKGGRTVLSK